ncbi:hypothetical protein EVAR_57660_1 [Eumeta japonica]|uniref:Uncharacterized protein n=1 Tax=Eumeta variegata TaxID=151549 RepID=A0A4C1YVT6_EUMVA|nr:hypothetical protein EVAR_57660_1 [Eumeta japonica]
MDNETRIDSEDRTEQSSQSNQQLLNSLTALLTRCSVQAAYRYTHEVDAAPHSPSHGITAARATTPALDSPAEPHGRYIKNGNSKAPYSLL